MGHNAFFQVNTPAAELLYAEAARFAALEELPDPVLWDVYGGVGSIGLYMGRNARVVGIEEMPGAVRYARGKRRRWAGRRTRWSRATPSPCSGVW